MLGAESDEIRNTALVVTKTILAVPKRERDDLEEGGNGHPSALFSSNKTILYNPSAVLSARLPFDDWALPHTTFARSILHNFLAVICDWQCSHLY